MFIKCTTLPAVQWGDSSVLPRPHALVLLKVELPAFAGLVERLSLLLQPPELARASRYHAPADRQRFIVTRAALRLALSKYTGEEPGRIAFATGPTHKPQLARGGVQFNVAHTRAWALIGIAPVAVGVDVEEVDEQFPFQEVLPLMFGAPEIAFVGEGPGARPRFYQSWTRKEAFAKATAQGLGEGFAAIPALDGTHPLPPGHALGPLPWTISSFKLAATCQAAVAYAGPSLPLRFGELSPRDFGW